jgi:hypothetical protein
MNLTARVGRERGGQAVNVANPAPSRRPRTGMGRADRGGPGRPEDSTRTVDLPGSPSHRGWARRVLGRCGVAPSGAYPAHPASPGSRGCRQRSASARWRRLAHRLLVLQQGVGVDDLLHPLDDLGLTVDAVLPGQPEHVGEALAKAVFGPPRATARSRRSGGSPSTEPPS